ncbi:MAG: hypothetical protein ABFD79_13785 [Phycisphaerales bacterium]
MKNKMRILLVLIAVFSFSSIANADLHWSAASGDWNSGSSWDVGSKPVAGDQAIVLWNHTITVTGNEYAGELNLGYVANGWINIAAGGSLTTETMHVGQTAEGNLEVGTMNVYGTAYAEQLFVANERANGRGVLNVYSGGLVRVGAWHCNIGNSGTQAGAGGTVNLKGTGSMEVNTTTGGILMTANGHIDIEAGQLKVLGDYRTQLQGYVNDGRITSNGGNSPHCVPAVSFLDGYTYVKTSGCSCTNFLPGDVNRDCYVDMFDLAFLAQNWLDCTDPSNTYCVQ